MRESKIEERAECQANIVRRSRDVDINRPLSVYRELEEILQVSIISDLADFAVVIDIRE